MAEREPKPRVEKQAENWVNDYITSELTRAMNRVEAIRCGDGCQCGNCRRNSVSDINSWVSWVSGGSNPAYEYKVDPKTGKVLRPDE
jgi:hypothetical protein